MNKLNILFFMTFLNLDINFLYDLISLILVFILGSFIITCVGAIGVLLISPELSDIGLDQNLIDGLTRVFGGLNNPGNPPVNNPGNNPEDEPKDEDPEDDKPKDDKPEDKNNEPDIDKYNPW